MTSISVFRLGIIQNNTANIGTIGTPKTLMALEKSEETSKISPTQPIVKSCQSMAVKVRFSTYETFPISYSFISFFKPLHSPLAKSPTRVAQLATRVVFIIISMTTLNVSLFITFLNTSCVRESHSPYPADAPTYNLPRSIAADPHTNTSAEWMAILNQRFGVK
ncbi:hypothetical protein CR513_46425, partial [Mucuna pruriens]